MKQSEKVENSCLRIAINNASNQKDISTGQTENNNSSSSLTPTFWSPCRPANTTIHGPSILLTLCRPTIEACLVNGAATFVLAPYQCLIPEELRLADRAILVDRAAANM